MNSPVPYDSAKALAQLKASQQDDNPLQAMFVEAFEKVGGVDFIADWAESNPDKFLNLLLRLTGSMPAAEDPGNPGAPGVAGGMHVHVHPSLTPGPLDQSKPVDGVTIDQD